MHDLEFTAEEFGEILHRRAQVGVMLHIALAEEVNAKIKEKLAAAPDIRLRQIAYGKFSPFHTKFPPKHIGKIVCIKEANPGG